jgi:threonine aldolase
MKISATFASSNSRTKVYSFKNDYSEGAHPNILRALTESNNVQQSGYGDDMFTTQATDLIRRKLKNQQAAVHLVSGGTQANLTVISSVLKPYESVVSAATGHINHHETGAIEATGVRIEAIATEDGKLSPELINAFLETVEQVHMRLPRMVYISQSTEVGTHYMKEELIALWNFCRRRDLYLFMDGARLASGLDASDMQFSDLGKYTDVFYIGGTKNGALLGEAIVINNPDLQKDFSYNLKMRGALLAKGRLLGIQFTELFKDNLYFAIGAHLNKTASRLAEAFHQNGYDFLTPSRTNQIFPILPYAVIEKLRENYDFYIWRKIDSQNAAIRLVTSWATQESVLLKFIQDLKACSAGSNQA